MGLYIQMHSMHGLFRSENLELGRDEDTGGQIVYVLELAKALAGSKEVDEVEIVTRRIIDDNYPGYSEKIENISKNLRIVRIDCGPKRYIKKVNLWPFLQEFISNTKGYISKKARVPDIFQSNYADSGIVCAKLSKHYKKSQVHTGHSLGIPKMQRLGVNKDNYSDFDKIYRFSRRIKAEQQAIDNSSVIIGSTMEEIRQQYSGYKADKEKFRNIAPGVDLKKFYPPGKKSSLEEKHTYGLLDNVLGQCLRNPEKKILAVLTRLDKRKNIHGLLNAFGKNKALQKIANLMVFTNTLSPENQKTVDMINSIIRRYDLYGKVALPGIKLDYDKDVPAFYRFLAIKKGVFVNPALIEPFGLTVLEASSSGVPVAATKYGGPSEIITDNLNGLLLDVRKPGHMSTKLKAIAEDEDLWKKISCNAVKNVRYNYSWKSAAKRYIRIFKSLI